MINLSFSTSFIYLDPEISNPCNPSPCGPNSQCREINGQAVCSCVQGYIGSPPTCRSECVVSSECPQNKACSNLKCKDPCPGACGVNTNCNVFQHNPICMCLNGFTGDPFTRCYPIREYIMNFILIYIYVGMENISLFNQFINFSTSNSSRSY